VDGAASCGGVGKKLRGRHTTGEKNGKSTKYPRMMRRLVPGRNEYVKKTSQSTHWRGKRKRKHKRLGGWGFWEKNNRN